MSSTIRKGLRILEYFAHAHAPRGVSELSRDLKMEKSAAQRAITTLCQDGYLERATDTGKYQLSLAVWELGSRAIERFEPRRLVHSVLRFASQNLGFTVFLSQNANPFTLYLDKVEGQKSRVYSSEAGQRLPIHRTAAGRAIMAWTDEESLKKGQEISRDWTGYVEAEAADLAAMQPDLALIRQRGYAITVSGYTTGVTAIAAPVWWNTLHPFGAITLAGDSQDLPPSEYENIGAQMISYALEATMSLGGQHWKARCKQEFFGG